MDLFLSIKFAFFLNYPTIVKKLLKTMKAIAIAMKNNAFH